MQEKQKHYRNIANRVKVDCCGSAYAVWIAPVLLNSIHWYSI